MMNIACGEVVRTDHLVQSAVCEPQKSGRLELRGDSETAKGFHPGLQQKQEKELKWFVSATHTSWCYTYLFSQKGIQR
jgi:hypothetical protein